MKEREIYMRLPPHHSLRFDPAVHNYEALLVQGWVVYDPEELGDSVCTDTHRRNAPRVVCKHGVSWWCRMAPRDNWWPEAPYQRDRALKNAAEVE